MKKEVKKKDLPKIKDEIKKEMKEKKKAKFKNIMSNLPLIFIGLAIVLVIVLIIFTAINKKSLELENEKKETAKVADNIKFKKEIESLNGKKTEDGKTYPEVEIAEDNIIKYTIF